MSRVQKKPIRRRLKDTAVKAEEPKCEPETVEVNEVPAAKPARSGIPRKPRPEIAVKPEADKPVRNARTVRAPAEEVGADAGERRISRPVSERSEGERRTERNGGRSSGSNYGGNRNGNHDRNSGRGDRNGNRDRNGGRNDRNGRGGFGGRKPAEKKKRPEKIVYEKTAQFVFPGEAVGAIEEYKPGFGTVNDDGTIRATVPGVVGINKEHRMISIIPKTKTPNTITEGDVVIASITDIRESNARVDIVAAEKSIDEEIVNNGNAEIYVSNIKDGFAKSVGDEFSVGDIVRAKVIDSSKIGLSTVEPEFGVLKAYCSRCKTSLTRSGDGLVCSNCGNQEKRKLAEGYGKGIPTA